VKRVTQPVGKSIFGETVRVRVLLVEDDTAIAESLQEGLIAGGHTVQHVPTGRAAIDAMNYDVMILDIGLPDIDGLDVCRSVRKKSNVPIIMLTARNEEIDRVLGLESGADDYLAKPFSFRELIARIRAVSRRSGGQPESDTVVVGGLVVDPMARRALLRNTEILLTAKEFDLLEFLARDPGRVHRRQEIMESVWDSNWFGSTKTLDVHIATLRRKLGDPRWIEAVRGIGFRFAEPK
jgi:DNA-binding response OmpR family regulator